ncbi:MAG: hypothetical protein JXN63_08780 [Candidatus Delongbacteria bacterium]|nr:hypothetical protein [Candidatus Delongbacteria bacterium]
MLIKIEEFAKKAGASLPDLLTRPVARKVLSLMNEKCTMAAEEELVICDFAGIEVIDPSFVDECLITFLKKGRQSPIYYVMLRNLSRIAQENIEGVINLYNENSQNKISILTEQLTCSNRYLIGSVYEYENEIVAFLRINGFATTNQLLSLMMAMEKEQTLQLLDSMYERGLIRKVQNKEPGYSSL